MGITQIQGLAKSTPLLWWKQLQNTSAILFFTLPQGHSFLERSMPWQLHILYPHNPSQKSSMVRFCVSGVGSILFTAWWTSNTLPACYHQTENNSEREVASNKCLHQETRKILNNLTLTSKETRNKEEMMSKISRREEITKIRFEIIIIGNEQQARSVNLRTGHL